MRYRFQTGNQLFEVNIERHGDILQASVDGQAFEVELLDTQPGQISLRFAGRPVSIAWAADGPNKWLSRHGCTYRIEKPNPRQVRSTGEPASGEVVRSPMPAQVRAVQVAEGDKVEKGQILLLLEAMKMEIRIKAPNAGCITRLAVELGQAVDKDQLLIEIGMEK